MLSIPSLPPQAASSFFWPVILLWYLTIYPNLALICASKVDAKTPLICVRGGGESNKRERADDTLTHGVVLSRWHLGPPQPHLTWTHSPRIGIILSSKTGFSVYMKAPLNTVAFHSHWDSATQMTSFQFFLPSVLKPNISEWDIEKLCMCGLYINHHIFRRTHIQIHVTAYLLF